MAKTVAAGSGGRRPRIVILGGGFAGLTAAATLGDAPVDVIMIDRTNHHVFQPLLYQVATAALSPSDISAPLRHIVHKQKNVEVVLGEVKDIDPDSQTVYVDDDRRPYPYDYLLVGLGTRHSYFGHDEWEKFAPGLKTLADASEIRQRFLLAFENAEKTDDPAERAACMTFVLVGAGPTGCELSGVMPEIARRAMHEDFRRINTADTKVILLEAGKRILPAFPEDLAARARKDLENLGVDIRPNAKVVNIDEKGVTLDGGELIPARTVIWAAGNAASPVAKSLKAPMDKAGRILVNPDLSVPGRPEIFVAGDLAVVKQPDGVPVPNVAQGAIQEGRHAARNIIHLLYREYTAPFSYWNKGDLAVIGRNKAIASLHLGKLNPRLAGFTAWFIWLFIHIVYLIGFRNRLSVLMQWAYAYVTYQRGVRIIEEDTTRKAAPAPTAESRTPA